MTVMGTGQVVALLGDEGFAITRSRLESLIATGRVASPALAGPSRAWTSEDIERVRRVLIDSATRAGAGEGGTPESETTSDE